MELLPLLEAEAKKKQVKAGGDKKSNEFQKTVSQKIEQPILQPEPKESPVLEKIKANTAVINEKKSHQVSPLLLSKK